MKILFFHGLTSRVHVEHDLVYDDDSTSETGQHELVNVDAEEGYVTIYMSPVDEAHPPDPSCWYITLSEAEMESLITQYREAKEGGTPTE